MLEIPAELIERLRAATRVAVLTGAGVSAESSIPTFRDAMTGLWASFSPEELATPQAFVRNPGMVYEWYAFRRAKCAEALPNPGHFALAELEARVEDFTLTTQNVDGLHQRAGSKRVLELHGSITRLKCFKTGRMLEGPIPETDNPPPLHPETGGMLRPDVVWFGEPLPERELMQSLAAARAAEVYFVIGTSAQVFPAASLAYEAVSAGAMVIEINADATAFSREATYSLRGMSGEILPAILRQL